MYVSEEKLTQEVKQLRERVTELENLNENLRKAQEPALPGLSAGWRTIIENVPNHVVVLDLEYVIHFTNQAFPNFLIEDIISKNWLDECHALCS